ncbi:FAD-dependent monooxygenase [Sphingomonas sp.]|jgi:2-polyprenyl-6-methoxyphenol hydroxylase-like FAD-dependent oxidoreductase|uniref:FAD-dependent monooxygenase n=1 Tax=Sphingomonas sp. TaxID=28214 RepID=UPI002E14084E|nr:FAD-dependent monooxygenase [Sphingomonas sp.]HEV7287624.1 FAD-dependent monooxygenase [Sphingomonas sp.]
MPRSKKILIVGAGIGGLCTGVALARIGVEVDIIDIKPDNSVPGVGWGLRTNGLRALREIGLLEPTLALGFPTPPLSYYDRNGRHVVDIPYGRQFDGIPNNVQLPRLGFLEMASAHALGVGCTIRMATTAVDIEQDADGVTVELSDGSLHRYDLVLGFDGINSSIRRYLFGEKYVPTPSGGVAWRAPVRAPDTLKGAVFCHGFGGKVGFVPLAGGMMYVIVTHHESGRPRHDPAAFPELMYQKAREMMGDSVFMADEIESLRTAANVAYTPLDTVMVPYPWHRGRVMIMGDAAHAMTPYLGSGAAMAIEDGVVFAQLLQSGDTLYDVQTKFMARRYPRVKTVWDISLQMMHEEFDSATPEALDRRLAHLVNEEPAALDYVHRILESDY